MKPIALCAFACAVCVSSVGSRSAQACIHPEQDDPAPPYLHGLEVGVWFDGSIEVMTYSPSIGVGGDSTSLSVVTATPSHPIRFSTASPDLFLQFRTLMTARSDNGVDAGDAGLPDGGISGSDAGGIDVSPTVDVGPYAVTVVDATGAAGYLALSEWLLDNDYAALDEGIATAYIEEGWSFVAVRVIAATGALESGVLPPLALTFETAVPTVPLRLEAGMPPFAANVYAIAPAGVMPVAGLEAFGMRVHEQLEFEAWRVDSHICEFQGIDPSAAGYFACRQEVSEGESRDDLWTLSWLKSDGRLNEPSAPIARWEKEFTLTGDAPGPDDGQDQDLGVPTGSGSDSRAGCTTSASPSPRWTMVLIGLVGCVVGSRRRGWRG